MKPCSDLRKDKRVQVSNEPLVSVFEIAKEGSTRTSYGLIAKILRCEVLYDTVSTKVIITFG